MPKNCPYFQAYVLGPKYDPGMADAADERLGTTFSDNKHHVRKVKLENFYLLLGKDLESLPQVPAGLATNSFFSVCFLLKIINFPGWQIN